MSSDLPDGLLDSGGDEAGDGSTASNTDEESFKRYTIVSIGDHRLAIPVTDVDTVIDRRVESTRVPRAPEAIEGVTDIRGQITTIVDPHEHFPDSGGPSASPSLLVFADREQPAATWVDEVEGVEAVPEDGVIDQSAYEPDEREGTALEHPLIVGAIRVERRNREAIVESVAEGQGIDDLDQAGDGEPLEQPLERSETDDGEVVVGEFSLDEETDRSDARERSQQSRSEDVDVEVTPILDVDRFLLAAGRIADERDPVTDTADVGAVGADTAAPGAATDDSDPIAADESSRPADGESDDEPFQSADPDSPARDADVDEPVPDDADVDEPVPDDAVETDSVADAEWPGPVTDEAEDGDQVSTDEDGADSEPLDGSE